MKEPRTPQEIINEVTSFIEKEGGSFIYRGIDTTSDKYGEKRVNSSLYRKYYSENVWGEDFGPHHMEKEAVEEARNQHFFSQSSNIEILTDLRHLGADVNLVDFSYNLYIALFFVCDGQFDKSGELIILSTKNAVKINEIDYEILVDGIIEPVKTSNSEKRVAFQSSVFVYPVRGYLSKKEWNWKIFEIQPDEKRPLLSYLEKYHNILENTIYNDLIGFIASRQKRNDFYLKLLKILRLREQGKHKEGVEAIDRIRGASAKYLEKDYFFDVIYLKRGTSNINLGKYSEAEMDIKRAIKINPRNAKAHYELGFLKIELKRYKEAEKDFDRAIELNSQYAEAYNGRGVSKCGLGSCKEKEEGVSKYGLNEYKSAEKDFNTALEINPQLKVAWRDLGILKCHLEKYGNAIKYLNKALEIDNYFAEVYFHRGIANFHLGKHKEAKKDFKKAEELNPKLKTPLSQDEYFKLNKKC